MENIFYNPEALETQLTVLKKFLDKTFLDIKLSRYGKKQAERAFTEFFTNYDVGFFPGEEKRQQFEMLSYYGDELYQVLMDYAISAYIADRQKGTKANITSLDQVHIYTDYKNENLNYDPKQIVEVVALATAENTYWTTNLIACNKKLKAALANAFVTDRYSSLERRKELDNTPKFRLVKLEKSKELQMSKRQLNRDIDNMIRDEDKSHLNFEELVNLEKKGKALK